jgi:Ethanolamine utilization protein EutJ (predicted chaperonin)
MKVNVVKDENGKVVATFENPGTDGTSIKPVLKPGHRVHEVEASEQYKRDIKAFYEHHSR